MARATGPFAPATVTAPRDDPSRVKREPADRPFTQEKGKEVVTENTRGKTEVPLRYSWRPWRERKSKWAEFAREGSAASCADGKVEDRAGEPNCLHYGFQKPGCIARTLGRLCPTLHAVPRSTHKTCPASCLCARTPLAAELWTLPFTTAPRVACRRGGARVS